MAGIDVSDGLVSRFAPVESLIPYARNARTHSTAQVAQIAASIAEFGFTNAVLADEKGIVAGHGRVLGAQLLYAAGKVITLPSGEAIPLGTVPVVDCSGWSDTKRKAYILADNQIALNAGYDLDLLKLELADLKLEGFDMDLLGFGDQLIDLMDPDLLNEKDPDDVPDVPEVAFSKMGDQWIMGPHRVRCGDSTKMEDWSALMAGELADCLWTDPPYNVDLGAINEMRDKSWVRSGGRVLRPDRASGIENDKMEDGKFRQFLLDMYRCTFAVLKPGAPAYVAHSEVEGVNFRQAFIEAGFKLQMCLIWVKGHLSLGRGDYQPKHEPILYGWKPGASHRWYGGRKQTSVKDMSGDKGPFVLREDGTYALSIDGQTLVCSPDATVEAVQSSVIYCAKPNKSKMHPTEKPVELVEKMLKSSARANDIIIDAFGGSGTTMMAAERLGMCSRLMEYDPRFCDVIAVRYANYTGRIPVHAVTGEPFPQEVIDKLTTKWEG